MRSNTTPLGRTNNECSPGLVRCGIPVLIFLACWLVSIAGHAQTQPHTQTQDPTATDSVGRLWVPAIRYRDGYARHYEEQCSGTLVTGTPGAAESQLVISAWHCLEDYRDLSRPVMFESPAGERREARLLVAGGSMDRDWALLRLEASLPGPSQLADREALSLGQEQSITMAGYPRTADPGQKKTLQQRHCAITGNAGEDLQGSCALNVGASGGGVFLRGQSRAYLGVISRGDGESRSIFVPLGRFERELRPYL